jgi:hypothetical protein
VAILVDKLSGQVFLFDIQGGGSTGTTTPYAEVNTYSQLPNPALNNGVIYVVRQGTGVYVLNRKDAGLYYSNGIVWTRLGDTPAFFNDANFKVYNNADTSKQIAFQLSGLTTNVIRTITMRDSNGTIAYLSDIGSKVDTSVFAHYTGVTAPAQFVGIGEFNFYTGQTQTALNNKQDKIYAIELTNTGATNVNTILPTSIPWNIIQFYDTNYFLFSGGSRIYIKATATYEVSYGLQTSNVDFSEKVIGTSIKKNGTTDIVPYSVPVFIGSVVLYGGSNSMSKYKFSASMGDYIELTTYRIGQSGTINTVPNGSWIKIEKI